MINIHLVYNHFLLCVYLIHVIIRTDLTLSSLFMLISSHDDIIYNVVIDYKWYNVLTQTYFRPQKYTLYAKIMISMKM